MKKAKNTKTQEYKPLKEEENAITLITEEYKDGYILEYQIINNDIHVSVYRKYAMIKVNVASYYGCASIDEVKSINHKTIDNSIKLFEMYKTKLGELQC